MKIFRLTTLATALFCATLLACQKPVPIDNDTVDEVKLTLETIDGYWQLTHLNGEVLHNQTQLYIHFDATQRYEMWDNMGSMYLRQTTGTYTIIEEDDDTYTLRGTYDNGLGDWNEEYRVVMYNNDRMKWWSRSEGTCLEFKYAMELPEEFN